MVKQVLIQATQLIIHHYSVSSWSQILIFSEFYCTTMKVGGHGKFYLKLIVWVIYRWTMMIKMNLEWCSCLVHRPEVSDLLLSKSMYF